MIYNCVACGKELYETDGTQAVVVEGALAFTRDQTLYWICHECSTQVVEAALDESYTDIPEDPE